ncbi:MAG: hypothetical protein FJ254_01325 [Phycisphaerae bacterium]|nr:hypothetical protein [Phycisphaerae bacterium]
MIHERPARSIRPFTMAALLVGAVLTAIVLLVPRATVTADAPQLIVGSQTFRAEPSTVEFMDWLATREMLRGGLGSSDGSLRALLIDRRLGPSIQIPAGGLRARRFQVNQDGTILLHEEPVDDACSVVLVPDERDPNLLMVLCEGPCSSPSGRCVLRFDPEALRFECACP